MNIQLFSVITALKELIHLYSNDISSLNEQQRTQSNTKHNAQVYRSVSLDMKRTESSYLG